MSRPKVSLVESSTIEVFNKPLDTLKVTLTTGPRPYVLHLATLSDAYVAALSSHISEIHFFDKRTLVRKRRFSGHPPGPTTDLRVAEQLAGVAPGCLISCGGDGYVRSWDERMQGVPLALAAPDQRPLLACDISPDGSTVAAGTELYGNEANIYYWDVRKAAAPIRIHTSTHSDDITCLKYGNTASGPRLLSSAVDGLVSISDPEEDDEQEAVSFVGHWFGTVDKVGWFDGPESISPRRDLASTASTPGAAQAPSVWVHGDGQTLGFWTDELDRLYDVDTRELQVCTPKQVTEDIIQAQSALQPGTSGFFMSSNENDLALASSTNLWDPSADWSLEGVWRSGHKGTIRCMAWDAQNHRLLTGGEDSRINVWPWLGSSAARSEDDLEADEH